MILYHDSPHRRAFRHLLPRPEPHRYLYCFWGLALVNKWRWYDYLCLCTSKSSRHRCCSMVWEHEEMRLNSIDIDNAYIIALQNNILGAILVVLSCAEAKWRNETDQAKGKFSWNRHIVRHCRHCYPDHLSLMEPSRSTPCHWPHHRLRRSASISIWSWRWRDMMVGLARDMYIPCLVSISGAGEEVNTSPWSSTCPV